MLSIESCRALIERLQDHPQELTAALAIEYNVLAEATQAEEVADRHDVAVALLHWAKASHIALQQLNEIAEYKLSCERRAGSLLREVCHRGGNRKGEDSGAVLTKLRIASWQSSRWQLAALPPDEAFRERNLRCKREGREITQKDWLEYCRQFKAEHDSKSIDPSTTGDDHTLLALRQRLANGEKYASILVTPPWQAPQPVHLDAIEFSGPGFTTRSLMLLPIGDLAMENSQLYLWVIGQHRQTAVDVLRRWQFEAVGEMILWHNNVVSRRGRFTKFYRIVHSTLILGVRGNCEFRCRHIPSLCQIRLGTDTPDEFQLREMLEKTGDQPFIHLFGRSPHPCWVVDSLRIPMSVADRPVS